MSSKGRINMNKMIAVFLVMVFAGAGVSCFAQQNAPVSQPAPAVQAAAKPVDVKTVIGKIQSVSIADPAKGTKSEIILSDETGVKTAVLVKETTTIYDVDWKPLGFGKLAKDEKAKVKYLTTKEGINEASSVSIVK